MKVVLGAFFRRGQLEAKRYYARRSERLADQFDDEVQAIIRLIAERKGGDHVGPHGHPCRRCSSFPYLVYYRIAGETLYILGVVNERRHPDYLRRHVG